MKKNINILIKKLVKKINIIENKKNILQKKKNILYKKESQKFKKKLKKKNISINTYINYISRARKQFINIKHYSLNRKIKYIKKNFNYFKKEMNYISKIKNTKIIYKEFKKIYKKLELINNLIKNINKIKINSTKNNIKIIKKSIKIFPEWKKELTNMINQKWYSSNKYIINKIQQGEIIKKKIKNIKINHEILFHLKVEKRKFLISKQNSYNKLKIKKINSITINYKNYLQEIYNILNKNINLNNIKNISYLSFALSAVSGRRMIEIIKLGKFKYIYKKNKIQFKGQAKNNKKKKYNIYLLYNSKLFIKKIKKLRNNKILKNIINNIKKKKNKYLSKNYQISNYFSNKFNKTAKNFFQNNKRTYKDTRSIYIRICFQKWFKKDKKWKKYDEDMFFYKILGHKNINSHIHYKQFKLINFNKKWKPKNIKNKRYKKLIKLDKKIHKIIKRKDAYKIHKLTKKILLKNDEKLINNYLLRKFGFNTILIQRYIKYISKYINQKKIKGRYKIIKKKIIK